MFVKMYYFLFFLLIFDTLRQQSLKLELPDGTEKKDLVLHVLAALIHPPEGSDGLFEEECAISVFNIGRENPKNPNNL